MSPQGEDEVSVQTGDISEKADPELFRVVELSEALFESCKSHLDKHGSTTTSRAEVLNALAIVSGNILEAIHHDGAVRFFFSILGNYLRHAFDGRFELVMKPMVKPTTRLQ